MTKYADFVQKTPKSKFDKDDAFSVSIITATYNCSSMLPTLIKSLKAQTDQSFEWIVTDGASTDGTVEVAAAAELQNVIIDSRADFGIYDALNRGIRAASGKFYIVLGADDVIVPTAIQSFKTAVAKSGADIVVAPVIGLGRILQPMAGQRWLRGGNAIVASHAVGTLIRKDLHLKLGLYSNKFASAADMYFILGASRLSDVKFQTLNSIVGEFGSEGLSSTNRLLSITDAFRVQMEMGENLLVQLLILNLRIVRAILTR